MTTLILYTNHMQAYIYNYRGDIFLSNEISTESKVQFFLVGRSSLVVTLEHWTDNPEDQGLSPPCAAVFKLSQHRSAHCLYMHIFWKIL